METAAAYQKIEAMLGDRFWRLNNLYHITSSDGLKIPFRMNAVQRKFYDNIHYFNVILKARQMGFSTFIMIYCLDAALFNSNHAIGVIAHTRSDAELLFRTKIKFAYDNLPDWLRESLPAKSSTVRSLEISNGSSLVVGTSLRSGTIQKLHISEYGKISAYYPEKAREIKTGALNTVAPGQQIFIESTAMGKAGEFYEFCETARKLSLSDVPLASKQPKFHFFPWYEDETNVLPTHEAVNVRMTREMQDYLEPMDLSLEQRAWYSVTRDTQGDDMKREHPSTPEEAFEGSLQGIYYKQEMDALRKDGRIDGEPHDPSVGVYTAWDLGLNDQMVIWFVQIIRGVPHFIDYHESIDEGWDYYANLLSKKRYTYLGHIFPHDGNKRIRGDAGVVTDRELAMAVGIRPIKIVPRTPSVMIDIRNYCKPTLLQARFFEENCALGIQRLDNYRKEWDKATGCYKDSHFHDENSHGADAFRTFAVAFKKNLLGVADAAVQSNYQPLQARRVQTNFRGLHARNF